VHLPYRLFVLSRSPSYRLGVTFSFRPLSILKAKGVSASIKHFMTNDQEFQRFSIAAADAVVLLKNDAKLLPLDPKKVNKIAVTGPNAKEATPSALDRRDYFRPIQSRLSKNTKSIKDSADVEVTYTLGVKDSSSSRS
jgi:beta-glucosidase-like glycosyl hydrolase